MATETVYRATAEASADYIATVEAEDADRQAAIQAFLERHGFAPDTLTLVRADRAVVGIQHTGEPPTGWRANRKPAGAIVPNLRTKKGKQIDAELGEIPKANGRELLPGGMPSYCIAAGHVLMEPGARIYDGRLFVTWSRPLTEPTAERLDPAVWEQVPLSTYHLAREHAEHAHA